MCANRHPGGRIISRQQLSIFLILIPRVRGCASLIEISVRPDGSSSRHLQPLTFSGARLFLAPSGERLSFRPFSYLSQFLEYFMENGDLRAVVWCFLPPHYPNCTYHLCVHADSRDPPLPSALHVSSPHSFFFGGRGGGDAERGTRTGGPTRACAPSSAYLGGDDVP